MRTPKVLIACEESQTVCTAFRERGIEAYSCDLQEPSGGHPERHILGDALKAVEGGRIVTMDGKEHYIDKWDLLIAHPPCTYLSNAGARWLYAGHELNNERHERGLAGKQLFLSFYNANISHICIENPVPSRVYNLPAYSQTVQPYQFGHDVTKKTCLWLKGLPPLTPTEVVVPKKGREIIKKDGSRRLSCWVMERRGSERAKARSKTFPGIAAAMADQWIPVVMEELQHETV